MRNEITLELLRDRLYVSMLDNFIQPLGPFVLYMLYALRLFVCSL